MNKKQHFFVWIGIALITFMAIIFDSKLMWLVAAIGLITESIYICKDEHLSFWDRKVTLLWLSILLFLILFINSSTLKREIEHHMGIRSHTSTKIIRK